MNSAGSSPMGSETSLTGDSLRRRPAHSRKASFSDDLEVADPGEEGALLAAMALEGMSIRSRHAPGWSVATPSESVASAAASGVAGGGGGARRVGSADALGVLEDASDGDDDDDEVTSAGKPIPSARARVPSPPPAVGGTSIRSRPPKPKPKPDVDATATAPPPPPPPTRVKAVVATGGFLVDKSGGEGKEYKGGDTALVTVPRGCTFRDLVVLCGIEPEEGDEENDDVGGERRDPVLVAAKRARVQYRDPSDASIYIRVKTDADVREMLEEWDAHVAAASASISAGEGGGSASASVGKLRVFVTDIATAAGRGGHRARPNAVADSDSPRESGGTPRVLSEAGTDGVGGGDGGGVGVGSPLANAEAAAKATAAERRAELQVVPSAELELVNRLGGGAFGEVHLALWRGSEVAVKFLTAIAPDGRDDGGSEASESDDDDDDAGAGAGADAGAGVAGSNPGGARRKAKAKAAADKTRGDKRASAAASREMESFLREAHTMAALQHPNVVFIYGVVNDGERLGIVEEFMSSGSLRRLLNLHQRDVEKEKERELARMTEGEGEAGESPTLALASAQPPAAAAAKERPSKNVLGAKLRARCALDVARGMAYLHSKRFVHFDLKCDNVLTARRGAKLQCKVCDFGLSKRRRSHASFVSGVNSHRGTLPWTAPELLNAPTRASEKVDVYSFAVLMWELWTGAYPYAGMHEQTIMCGIMMRSLRPDVADGENPAGSPVNGWKSLMFEAWRDKPEERPSFEEIVKRLEGMLKASEGVP